MRPKVYKSSFSLGSNWLWNFSRCALAEKFIEFNKQWCGDYQGIPFMIPGLSVGACHIDWPLSFLNPFL